MLLSDDHQAVQDAVRAFVQAEIAPKAAAWDKSGHFPKAELRGLAESPCSDVVGTYDVPGGALTVLDDGSARFVPVADDVELGS